MESLPIEVVAVLFGIGLFLLISVWRLNEGWVKDARKMNQPMSITLKTGESPADVAHKADIANRNRFLLGVGVVVLAWAVIWRVNPTLAMDLLELTAQVVIALFTFLAEILFVIVEQIEAFVAWLGGIG